MQSHRLQQIIKYIPDGVGVADIGTDHAQIPIFLAKHTQCQPIIAGEKNSGPFETALNWIKESGFSECIDLRQGSGLTILQPREVEWVVIAGMGFKTIIEILSESEEIARSLTGLVLQPMQGPEEMRRWLYQNSYQIIDETLVKEDDKIFHIMVIKSGESVEIEDIFYEVGPILYQKGDVHLSEHLQNLISYYTEVLDKITSTQGIRSQSRIQELKQKIHRFEEVFEQWQRRCNEL